MVSHLFSSLIAIDLKVTSFTKVITACCAVPFRSRYPLSLRRIIVDPRGYTCNNVFHLRHNIKHFLVILIAQQARDQAFS